MTIRTGISNPTGSGMRDARQQMLADAGMGTVSQTAEPSGGERVSLNRSAGSLIIRVRSSRGLKSPIPNAHVQFEGQGGTTDKYGGAEFRNNWLDATATATTPKGVQGSVAIPGAFSIGNREFTLFVDSDEGDFTADILGTLNAYWWVFVIVGVIIIAAWAWVAASRRKKGVA